MTRQSSPITSTVYGHDTHAITSADHGSSAHFVLRFFEQWIKQKASPKEVILVENQPYTQFRLFYRDRYFRDLMFRLMVGRAGASEVVLARAEVCGNHDPVTHLLSLVQGLERIADALELRLTVEFADAKLARVVQRLGYVRCGGRDGSLAPIWTEVPSNWSYQPNKSTGMALIEMPLELIHTIDGFGLRGKDRQAVQEMYLDELRSFQDRLVDRIKYARTANLVSNGRD